MLQDLHDPDLALHEAARAGQEGVVQLLLEARADANLRDSTGRTLLHLAATENDLKLAHLLLDAAADMSLVDRSGKQAFQVALERGRINMARLMLMAETCGADEDACTGIDKEEGLLSAASLGHEDIVRLLLEMQANMDAVDQNGMTALHQSCARGQHGDSSH